MSDHLKRTALYENHLKLGGRMVPFGGWEMPVQYSSIKDEHLAVREHAGLFDISHMGEFFVTGQDSAKFLNSILTNNVLKLQSGQGQYTLMCQKNGGVIDDLYLYCLEQNSYLLIVNASRLEDDWQWIHSQKELQGDINGDLSIENQSDQLGAIAAQGPSVKNWIDSCFETDSQCGLTEQVSSLQKNQISSFRFNETRIWVGATGYTGEEGIEIIAPNTIISEIWDTLLAKGHAGCVQPAGLGARDTLRTEMCYPLYGHELTTKTTPLEAGLGFFVDLDGEDFVGKQALVKQKASGLERKCIAFQMLGRSAPPRPEYKIYSKTGDEIGCVTSGTSSPSLNNGIGMAYVDIDHTKIGNVIEIEIRKSRFAAEIVKKPIYRRQKPH